MSEVTSPAPPTTAAIRVVIADDHPIARAGLRALLAGSRDLEVVGEAADGREAVALCRQLRPDLVLMDLHMPVLDGLSATRAIKEQHPETAVLIVTMQDSADYLVEALRAGAAGYVLKRVSRGELLSGIRRVLDGEALLPPDLAAQVLGRLARESTAALPTTPVTLTTREHDVLACVARGRTNQQIARALSVSISTVKGHLEHIIRKLDACDRTQAAVRAIELGLLEPPALDPPAPLPPSAG